MRDFRNKVIVITGAASGIGLALGKRFVNEGACVILSDFDEVAIGKIATKVGATSIAADIRVEDDTRNLIETVLVQYGRIDMFISSASMSYSGGINLPADKWKEVYDLNVMSHVYAAKYVLPSMIERGSGYLLNTASAAGLLTEFNAAPYAVTMHAAVGFAEWLALTYKSKGIGVSVLCPGAIQTPMFEEGTSIYEQSNELDAIVDKTIRAVRREIFMISTHEYVDRLLHLKGYNYEEYMQVMDGYKTEKEEMDKIRQEEVDVSCLSAVQ